MFTIGEFARLGGVSPRMLRHYDALGLLRPEKIGEENGYRYYASAQLETIRKIENLKGYGFSLAQICKLLPFSEEELAEELHTRRLALYGELSALKKQIRQMEDIMLTMKKDSILKEKYPIIVMEGSKQRVVGIRRRINIAETNVLFEDLYKKVEDLGLKKSGVAQQVYLGEEFNYDDMDVEAQVEVLGEDPEVKTIPAMTYVATTHRGPFEGLHNAYEALGDWFREHPEYEVAGPSIERYIRDVDEVDSEEDLETGVLFPVKKVK